MKKYIGKLTIGIITIAALFPFTSAAQVKHEYRTAQTSDTEFNPHWFGQAQVGAGYTVNEGTFSNGISPAAAIYVGYRPVSWFSARFGFSVWEAKGKVLNPDQKYKFNYVQGNLDAIASLTTLFCGYNAKRLCDVYLGIGIGAAYAWNNDEAEAYKAQHPSHLTNIWYNHRWFPAGRGILGIDFRCSNSFAINVEANANLLSDRFNSKSGDNSDWQLNLLVGVKWKFGKSKKAAPVAYTEPAPEPQPKAEPKPEPKPAVKEEPKPVAKTEPVAVKVEPKKADIFFDIRSYTVSADEMKKIDELVKFMNANPSCKVTVSGYADKETGSGSYNMKLSQKRANSIAKALESRGISADRIKVEYFGDTVQPFSTTDFTKNRVVICVTNN